MEKLSCLAVSAVLFLCGTFLSTAGQQEEYRISDWIRTLNNIKEGSERLNNYSSVYKYSEYIAAELPDGLCQFKCPDGGHKSVPRPYYKPAVPDGCTAPVYGFHFDIGIPPMTKCCNQHDRCYDTCGQEKHDCDDQFHVCLETMCENVQITLGLDQSVQACKSAVTLLYDSIVNAGCKPYLDSQKAACICRYEVKSDL